MSEPAWIALMDNTDSGMNLSITEHSQNERMKRLVLVGSVTHDLARKTIVLGGELEICASEEGLDRLARESGMIEGKWLVYCSPDKVNDVWRIVASSMIRGELGFCIKVSTARKVASDHVVCVYTKNFIDLEDIMRVRKKLRELGFTNRLFYKPDIYTRLNIYSNSFSDFAEHRYSG